MIVSAMSARSHASPDLFGSLGRIGVDGCAGEKPVTERDRPDAVLIRAARDGSETALDILFRRHWPRALQVAFLICQDRAGAEDIAQEAFLSAVRALDRFDRRRPFAPWLHRIVVNRAIDWTRMRAARPEWATDVLPETATPLPEGPDRDVLTVLAELEPEQRAVIVLRYVHDLTPGEIARVLGLPRGTVNSRLRRGLDRMAGRLEPGTPPPLTPTIAEPPR
jgi:RNA polymerase sigma-70 factor (ECF subfamily)